MLPIARKSVEPLAAHADPRHVPAKHQALHHFVANAPWSDRVLLDRVRSYVEPHLGLHRGTFWIVDDTGHAKCGTHSVGVARQYCGQLGKIDNCQVAVSLSLSTDEASVPMDYQLYLSIEWAKDRQRRRATGVPDSVRFATKPQIALAQIRAAQQRGVTPGIVLADAAYGTNTAFREGVQALGLSYAVSVISSTSVWAPGSAPLPPAPYTGRGRVPTRARRAPGHQPLSVKDVALGLELAVWHTVAWREGTNQTLRSRFARVRVRAAHRHNRRVGADDEQWLLIEWPKGQAEPTRYWPENHLFYAKSRIDFPRRAPRSNRLRRDKLQPTSHKNRLHIISVMEISALQKELVVHWIGARRPTGCRHSNVARHGNVNEG